MSRAWCLVFDDVDDEVDNNHDDDFYYLLKSLGVRPKWGEKQPFKHMTKHGKLGEILENSEKI